MKATYINYKDTLSFSSLLLKYLENDPSLTNFYGSRPDYAGFSDQIDRKSDSVDREVLVQTLLLQQEKQALSEQTLANIRSLQDPNSYTITTGHQLNIFTGPLYFIFKIVTAIKLSRDLKQQFPDKNFVPVYWMASEDHDFEEINHTHVFKNKITWNKHAQGATGRLTLEDIQETVKAYQNILGLSDNSCKLSKIVETAYSQENLADATSSLVNQLFGEYGIVVIDADHTELKKLFVPIIKEDIIKRISSKEVEKTSGELENAGFKSQVHVRDINFFYLTDEMRERIVINKDGDYELYNHGITFTEEELIHEIETHPARFSPNVITRPLYQEVILPNIAYVGGGAEISYWMQLKGMFDYYQVDFPILVPRNSAMIAAGNLSEKIYRLNFTFKSIFKNTNELKKEYVRVHSKHRLNLNDEWREFTSLFEKIKLRAHKIDPTLGPSTDAIQARLKKAIDRLEKKLLKADQNNYSEALNQIDRIKEKLFPNGNLQERTENFGSYYVTQGDSFIEELVQHFNPLDFKFTVLY